MRGCLSRVRPTSEMSATNIATQLFIIITDSLYHTWICCQQLACDARSMWLVDLVICQIMNGETSRADSPLCGWWLRVCSHMIATRVTPKTGIKRRRDDLANSASTLGESASWAYIQTIKGARCEKCCVSVTRGSRRLPVVTCYVARWLSSSCWGHFLPAVCLITFPCCWHGFQILCALKKGLTWSKIWI